MTATLYRTAAAQLTAEKLTHIHQQMAARTIPMSSPATRTSAATFVADDPGDSNPLENSDDADSMDGSSESSSDGRHRTHIEREWPPVGTKLVANYFGTDYTATIIPASKKLKSGKQLRIESGAAAGTVCDSYSEAMIVATETQREQQNLARKGVSNGWLFWQPEA